MTDAPPLLLVCEPVYTVTIGDVKWISDTYAAWKYGFYNRYSHLPPDIPVNGTPRWCWFGDTWGMTGVAPHQLAADQIGKFAEWVRADLGERVTTTRWRWTNATGNPCALWLRDGNPVGVNGRFGHVMEQLLSVTLHQQDDDHPVQVVHDGMLVGLVMPLHTSTLDLPDAPT